MYYGYNETKEIIVSDQEFIELLGYKNFNELIKNSVIETITFKKNRIYIEKNSQYISADFKKREMLGAFGNFYLIELNDISFQTTKELKPNYKTIYLDVDKISKEIGLSVEDYKLYLDSFIDQSIIDEKRLLEGNDKVIKNLSNLALTLKIPHINILLLKIKKLSPSERMQLIDEYYNKLALITLEKPEDEDIDDLFLEESLKEENKEELLNEQFSDLLNKTASVKSQEKEELPEDDFEDFIKETHTPTTVKPQNNIKEIELDKISALPISYNPQKAADELNLPVELIEEFVDDFIEQARQDIDHLLTSYYQKDMDNIHELGHKLKGAASNLRINELADILEEIQFCTEHSKLEGLFIRYWGHFLSLEDYMKQLDRK